MHDHDTLDRELGSALSTYGTPPEGLEDRVLRSITLARSMPAAKRARPFTRPWLPWVIAGPIAAAAALFCFLPQTTHAPEGKPAQAVPHSKSATEPAVSLAVPARPHLGTHHRSVGTHNGPHLAMASRRALPKRDLFPSPEPLSAREQALAEFGAHAPKPMRQSLIAAQVPEGPITISAIQIQPLTMPELGPN